MRAPATFWRHVAEGEGCWEWLASKDRGGYGNVRQPIAGTRLAHRIAYQILIAPIDRSIDLDHLCRNRGCVNPAHLEPVSRRLNVLRGTNQAAERARQTHCKRGHEFTPENTYRDPKRPTTRRCRECARSWIAAKRRAA